MVGPHAAAQTDELQSRASAWMNLANVEREKPVAAESAQYAVRVTFESKRSNPAWGCWSPRG